MSELREPRTFDEWRSAKAEAFENVRKFLPGFCCVAEDTLAAFLDLLDAASPANPNDDRVMLLPMVGSTHRALLNAFQLLMEGQFLEAFSVFRPSAEMAGHALRMSRDVKLVKVWLDRDVDEGAFNKAFKPHLPKEDPLTAPLFEFWDLASDTGLHSNAKLVIFHFESDKTGMTTSYFLNDFPRLQMFLGYFIRNTMCILKIYAVGLGAYFGRDFMPTIQDVLNKCQDLVNSYAGAIRAGKV